MNTKQLKYSLPIYMFSYLLNDNSNTMTQEYIVDKILLLLCLYTETNLVVMTEDLGFSTFSACFLIPWTPDSENGQFIIKRKNH